MREQVKPVVAAALLALGIQGAWAQGTPEFRFSGFGTVSAVKTDTDQAQFRSSVRQKRGAADEFDFGVDTRLGVQADVKFDPVFSAVGQVLASRRDADDTPDVEWLYAQAQVAPWAAVRAGRMGLPTYLVSDYRNAGYAQHWLRAPNDVYAAMPITSFDGVQLLLRRTYGATTYTVQPSLGTTGSKLDMYSGAVHLKQRVRSIRGINLVAEHGEWTVRLGSVKNSAQARVEMPGGTYLVRQEIHDTFNSVGAQYDDGKLLVMSEYVTRRVKEKVYDADAYYVSGGYRLGNFTPYATVGAFRSKSAANIYTRASHTHALGLRWDAMKNVAIKTQFETTQPTAFQFVRESAAFTSGFPTVRVLSVAADFVF